MSMVNIRYMRMRVLLRFVTMPVAVFAYRHGIVQVPVVPVVVAVGVLIDAQGRFQQVVKRSHIPSMYREQARSATPGSVTIEHPGTDMITILPVSH